MAGNPKNPPEDFPFSRYKGNDEVTWEAATRIRLGLDAPAIRKKKSSTEPSTQLPLFEAA
jgi:hypothetical protein